MSGQRWPFSTSGRVLPRHNVLEIPPRAIEYETIKNAGPAIRRAGKGSVRWSTCHQNRAEKRRWSSWIRESALLGMLQKSFIGHPNARQK